MTADVLIKMWGTIERTDSDYHNYVKQIKDMMKDESALILLQVACSYAIKNFSEDKDVIMWDPVWWGFITNASDRSKLLKFYGLDAIWEHINAELIDSNDEYQLVECDLLDGVKQKVLFMHCPSTGDPHANPVRMECQTVDEALLFMNLGVERSLFGVET